jgi:hypothetical protein
MAHDSEMNQDLNSTRTAFSPAHQHLEQNEPEAVVTAKSKQEKLDDMAMESARRAQNRVHNNAERIPSDTIFSK